MKIISIRPTDTGWIVKSDNELPSFGDAGAAARALGQQLANQGHQTEIHIYLRNGERAGQLVFAPSTPPYLVPAARRNRSSSA